MTKVSIILPVYNVAAYLPKCIRSLQSQTYKDFEAIFVNDGSTDNSLEVLREFERLDPRFKVFDKENGGSGAARNYGLDRAKGEYIYFVDPDDWIDSNLLHENVELIERLGADMVIFGFWTVNSKGAVLTTWVNSGFAHYTDPHQVAGAFADIMRDNYVFYLWNKIYRHSWLSCTSVRFPSQRTNQDAMFNLSAFRQVNSLILNPKAYYNYLVARPFSATTTVNLTKFQDGRNVVEELRQMLDAWGVNDRGIYNLRIINVVYSGYVYAADHALMNDGYASFSRSIDKYSYSSLLGKRNSNALPSWKGKLKLVLVNHPPLIYAIRYVRQLSGSIRFPSFRWRVRRRG